MIGGRNWMGGYNYLLNLLRTLSEFASARVHPVLFLGADASQKDVIDFEDIPGVTVVCSSVFNEASKGIRLRSAILIGSDRDAEREFQRYNIDVVFETGEFFGWRFSLPVLAWFPDFQHKHLKYLFGFMGYWRREIGFRAQILSSRSIMLSSEDARKDCEKFYPSTCDRTHVVSFAVPQPVNINFTRARAVADTYNLPKSFFFLPNQLWKHKNHECVLDALKILKTRGLHVVVAVTGGQVDLRHPEHVPSLLKRISSEGLESNFKLLGLLPFDDIMALMQASSALMNPSTFEGWSTTVEEAKSMGTPLILSSLRVHQEQCSDAIFFDPGCPDELASILAGFVPLDTEARIRRASMSEKKAASNIEKFADDFSELVEDIICARPK
jgi:glycosyltransferase involved in cell wall biosynthesis